MGRWFDGLVLVVRCFASCWFGRNHPRNVGVGRVEGLGRAGPGMGA